MLFQYWANVEDGVPTLKQLWVNCQCLLIALHKDLTLFCTIDGNLSDIAILW